MSWCDCSHLARFDQILEEPCGHDSLLQAIRQHNNSLCAHLYFFLSGCSCLYCHPHQGGCVLICV